MNSTIEGTNGGSAAELRLAILHQAGKAGAKAGKVFRVAMASADPNYMMIYGVTPLAPVSFSDIGMASIEELEDTFKELDFAISTNDSAEIKKHLARLSSNSLL